MSHCHVRARTPWLAEWGRDRRGALVRPDGTGGRKPVGATGCAAPPRWPRARGVAGLGAGEKDGGVRSCVLVYFRLEADVIHSASSAPRRAHGARPVPHRCLSPLPTECGGGTAKREDASLVRRARDSVGGRRTHLDLRPVRGANVTMASGGLRVIGRRAPGRCRAG